MEILASFNRSSGTLSWLDLKTLLLDYTSARKNRANNLPGPSECRAPHRRYPKRHAARSQAHVLHKVGVTMFYMVITDELCTVFHELNSRTK